ncbi:unnamed protein product [Sphenostylis stenocarpa]|uniref:Transmembrane protein n=1 Tax=Sphenostylis stenocarpa TaxID=92480 RepID=A0AA86SEG8_9FABA|nr:unnamed protein product [Sphenostylis stenocarpa]
MRRQAEALKSEQLAFLLSRRSHAHARHNHDINLLTIMLRFTSNSDHSFFFLFFFLSLFLFSTSAPTPSDGVEVFGEELYEEEGVVPWTARRSTAEVASSKNGTLVLAEERTRRKDWFNGFRRYTGGWNISSAYYITVFHFFLHCILIKRYALLPRVFRYVHCGSFIRCGFSLVRDFWRSYTRQLCVLLLLAGCTQLYSGQSKIGGSTSNTLDYVVSQAQSVAENLTIMSTYFDSAKHIVHGVPFSLHIDFGPDIDDIKIKVLVAADYLSNTVKANSKIIHKVIDGVRLALIIVAAVLFFVAFLRLIFSLRGWQCPVYFLVVIGWILVTGTLLLCAAFLFVYNVTGDTCVAMDEWVVNPTTHTAVDEILPCVEKATVCEVSLAEQCTSAGRLTPTIYTKLGDAVNVTRGLFEYGPFFADLVDCSFVRKTFNEISSTYCPPLRRYIIRVCVASVVVSAAVIVSLVSSVVFVREQCLYLHGNGAH